MYLKEGEDHATAQDEFVDLAQHGLNDRDLRRDLTMCVWGGWGGVGDRDRVSSTWPR